MLNEHEECPYSSKHTPVLIHNIIRCYLCFFLFLFRNFRTSSLPLDVDFIFFTVVFKHIFPQTHSPFSVCLLYMLHNKRGSEKFKFQTAHLHAQGVMAFKCVLKCYQLHHKAVRCFQHDLCCSLSLITIDDIDVLSSLEGKVLILTFSGVRVPTLHWYPQKKILTLCCFFFHFSHICYTPCTCKY